MSTRTFSLGLATLLVCLCLTVPAGDAMSETIDDLAPGLLKSALATASFGPLPRDVLVKMGDDAITQADLAKVLAKASGKRRADLEKNALFLVQELATKRLLLRAATESAAERGASVAGLSWGKVVNAHLQALAADVAVTDDEVKAYYEANPAMFKGASLRKVRTNLKAFLRKKKRQALVNKHVHDLGSIYRVTISEDWGKAALRQALDNPLDRARMSGRPTLIEFVAPNCPPCRKMEPILEKLEKKYHGEINIVSINTPDYPLLTTRYGVTVVPVQVFMDVRGNEVSRHTGFYGRKDLEREIAAIRR